MNRLICLVNKKIKRGKDLYVFKKGEDAPELSEDLKNHYKSIGYIGGTNSKQALDLKKGTQSNVQSKEVIIDPDQHTIEEEEVLTDLFRKEDLE